MSSYLILDIENNSSAEAKRLGRKAGSPLVGDKIVAIGMISSTITEPSHRSSYERYIYSNDLKEFYIEEDVLVGHNLSHDLQWLWPLETFQNWLKQGGVIWDTQLCEYIITGQQSKYASLRDIAVNKYGCPERKKYLEDLLFNKDETIKANLAEIAAIKEQIRIALDEEKDTDKANKLAHKYWAIREEIKQLEGHHQVSDLPIAAVLKDVKNDVLDTEQIYLKQLKIAEEQGQIPLIEAMNDSLLASIEISYNGMKIDLDTLKKNKLELEQKLEQKKAELMNIVGEWWK